MHFAQFECWAVQYLGSVRLSSEICQHCIKKQTAGSRYQPSTQTNKETSMSTIPVQEFLFLIILVVQTLLEKVEQ